MPQSSAASEVKTKPLSYKEYFSQEREFKTESEPKKYKDYLYFINKNDVSVLYQRELGSDYLCRKNMRSGAVEVILEEPVDSIAVSDSKLLCIVNSKQIIQIDLEGKNRKVIYEAAESISSLRANAELIFFLRNKTVCRMYRPTQTIDEIYHNNDLADYEPLSNVAIKWEKDNPDWLKYYDKTHDSDNAPNIPRKVSSIYNSLTKEEKIIPPAYW
ncbi:hypothetical protein SAMN05192585_10821 [Acetanaerobacterium elongatum]|uniref:Uncharacterized protein n=1 Tax=Acetanaerobacterium elongatum TaxID=258515 RepID=A0A1G9XBC5_9FIRM|nr:hypothetical protein SAMN05192585_10821 [Acetanaerobacterium elongatum]